MRNAKRLTVTSSLFVLTPLILSGCGGLISPVNVSNSNAANRAVSNTNTNVNTNRNAASSSSVVNATEPTEYQATVTLKIEAMGDQQKAALPPLSANVARSGTDRRMVFTMPAGGRVVYLDKAGTNYLILPEKRQYAELN